MAIGLVLAATTVAAAATGGPSSAAAASFFRADQCTEHQAFFDGDSAAVAARLPGSYTASTDPSSGQPLLFARAEHCLITVGGATRPATIGIFGIVINSPDGRGCASGAPGIGGPAGQQPPVCNWYPIEWVANDQRLVDWLNASSPGPRAVLVPGLAFTVGGADSNGVIPFHFAAPAPAPSPFSMEDSGHPGSATINVRGGYWMGAGTDAVKVAFSTDDITPGQASGTVQVTPGTEAARLIGSSQAAYLPQYSEIAGEHWGHGSYRKQLLGPAPNTDSFSGSCSISGTDTFDPPATNTAQDLHVTYNAKGTCSGTLDGKQIRNTPVSWYSQGHSYGSCPQANTVEPGFATLTFPNGAVIQSTFDFSSLLTQITFSFYGVRSGFASGQATFLTQQTGPDTITGCQGSGDRQVPMDLSLTTDSPLISPRGSHQSPAGNPGAASSHRLHLSVRPQMVAAGANAVFRFKVVAAHGRPVARAVVSLGGRRARTNSHGAATLRFHLPRPGARIARARKPGFRGARATIHVVRGRG